MLLSLALVVGLLYIAGGFKKRTDLLEPIEPGALIVTGPYELTFTEATAQPENDTDGQVEGWEVIAIGRARNTGDETMAPSVFGNDSVFVVKDPAGALTAEAYCADSAAALVVSASSTASTWRRVCRRSTTASPSSCRRSTSRAAAITLGVAELVYEDPYLTTDEKTWDNGLFGFRVDLPAAHAARRS